MPSPGKTYLVFDLWYLQRERKVIILFLPLLLPEDAPKAVTTVIQSFTPIREGDNVTLVCKYNSSNPDVTNYKWSPQGSGSEVTPGVLKIQKVTWNSMPVSCAACNPKCSWAPSVSLNVHCE